MDLDMMRRLSAAIIMQAVRDWHIKNDKVDKLFFRKHGGKEAEIRSFFCSDYCDDMLRLMEIDLTGPEMWRLLSTGQVNSPRYMRWRGKI